MAKKKAKKKAKAPERTSLPERAAVILRAGFKKPPKARKRRDRNRGRFNLRRTDAVGLLPWPFNWGIRERRGPIKGAHVVVVEQHVVGGQGGSLDDDVGPGNRLRLASGRHRSHPSVFTPGESWPRPPGTLALFDEYYKPFRGGR